MKSKARSKKDQVKKMKDNFIELRKKDVTVPKIAKMFDLAPQTVYNYYDSLCKEYNMTREEFDRQIKNIGLDGIKPDVEIPTDGATVVTVETTGYGDLIARIQSLRKEVSSLISRLECVEKI